MTIAGLAALIALAGAASAETYNIDPAHSTIGFKVKHMMVSTVHGKFDKFKGSFAYDEKAGPDAWKAEAEIEAASINTGVEMRDNHLRTGDFFDAKACPTIKFASKSFTKLTDGKGKMTGDLTMRCTTKPVTLDVELGGVSGRRAGFTMTGSVNRQDFGVKFNKMLEGGGAVVGDKVDLVIDVEGIVQEPAAEKPADTTVKK
jgi:polyisoprenoid-binding protein YceI